VDSVLTPGAALLPICHKYVVVPMLFVGVAVKMGKVPPAQMVVASLPAEILTVGNGLTVIDIVFDVVETQPLVSVTVTVME